MPLSDGGLVVEDVDTLESELMALQHSVQKYVPSLASYPGPLGEEKGPGTHCLHMLYHARAVELGTVAQDGRERLM